MSNKPKILLLDIETAPILGYVWGLWDQNVGINQIKKDWHVLSWAALWLGDSKEKIMYQDQRKAKDIQNDKEVLKGIWKLLDEADCVITQNGKNFDIKKLNARFVINGFKPPSSFKHVDTLQIAKRHFGFTSNKLEYMAEKLGAKHKKMTIRKYDGFALWTGCLAGEKAAWEEMKKYNCQDVFALLDVYNKLVAWDSSVNFNLFTEGEKNICKCGSTEFQKYGFGFTNTGKFQRYQCKVCGAETRSRKNLFSKEKRASLRVGTTR